MAQIKILDNSGLAYLWSKIKAIVPTKVSDLTNDAGYQTSSNVNTAITNKIDSTMSDSSTNAIQNNTVKSYIDTGLSGKVDTVSGKGLSSNDFTNELKNKLDGIDSGATATVIDDTLSTTGQAADAKAVGDALDEKEAYISALTARVEALEEVASGRKSLIWG